MNLKRRLNSGDIFVIPILNGSFIVGQVLDFQIKNVVRVALFNDTIEDINKLSITDYCHLDNVISLLTCTIDKFNNNSWKIIGNKSIEIPFKLYPNEEFRRNGWVGAKTYGSAIVEKFLNSFYGILPWNDMADPLYLDKLLFSHTQKPSNLIYIKNNIS